MNSKLFGSPLYWGLLLFFLISPSISYSEPRPLSLSEQAHSGLWWQDLQWIRLVQYQSKTFGGWKSDAESETFFLAPDGKTNPQSELLATLEAFENGTVIKSKDGKFEDPAICMFPARRLWLESKSGHKFPPVSCERYERFLEILAPQSLTYVFSSYYLNNPASAFGHTFLRINKAPSSRDGERYELFDYGVGYAALKVSENPFVYSFLGVSGMMPGSFDINPYYYKVREYNDFESRDLWEYDLDFTPQEVSLMVAYIWELLNANFNYSYFSENCAYRILSIFEVGRPGLELVSQLKSQVMPADTVQTLHGVPGLVKEIHYRPSVRAVFENRLTHLNDSQKNHIMRFAQKESLENLQHGLTTDEQRPLLDTAIDYLDFKYPKEILRKQGKYHLKKEVLAARAKLGGTSEVLKFSPPYQEAPHQAQGSRRIGIGQRSLSDRSLYLLNYKFSLHDLLDPKIGYPPTAEITMGDIGLSLDPEENSLKFDRVLFYDVISLSPIDAFHQGISWRLKFSRERGYDSNCSNLCSWTELSGGTGSTFQLLPDLEFSLWMKATLMTSSNLLEDHWVLGAGPAMTLRWNKDFFSALLESYYRYDYRGQSHETRQHSASVNFSLNRNWSLRFGGFEQNKNQFFEGRLLYYY